MVETANVNKEYYREPHARAAFGGTMAESFAGMGAVALAIIGLAHVFPQLLASIASIAVGISLAFEGGAISARYAALIGERQPGEGAVGWQGTTSLFMAGAAGIALGILALVNVKPMILIPVAAVVFGAALILDSGANAHLATLEARYGAGSNFRPGLLRESAQESAGTQVLVGVGGVALGIIALTGIAPLVLSLVAMLIIGGANLMSGALIGERLPSTFR